MPRRHAAAAHHGGHPRQHAAAAHHCHIPPAKHTCTSESINSKSKLKKKKRSFRRGKQRITCCSCSSNCPLSPPAPFEAGPRKALFVLVGDHPTKASKHRHATDTQQICNTHVTDMQKNTQQTHNSEPLIIRLAVALPRACMHGHAWARGRCSPTAHETSSAHENDDAPPERRPWRRR